MVLSQDSNPRPVNRKSDDPTISNVTSVTDVRSANARLFAGTWHPLLSVITTLYYVAIIFHRRV